MHDELMGGNGMSREPQQWHMPHALACLESLEALENLEIFESLVAFEAIKTCVTLETLTPI